MVAKKKTTKKKQTKKPSVLTESYFFNAELIRALKHYTKVEIMKIEMRDHEIKNRFRMFKFKEKQKNIRFLLGIAVAALLLGSLTWRIDFMILSALWLIGAGIYNIIN